MKAEIKKVVRTIYGISKHRRILEAIFENRPTLEDVRSRIEKAAADCFAKSAVKCTVRQWPTRTANPAEIWIMPEPLEKSGFGIIYMLRSRAHRPFIGDSFTILITAWYHGAAARKRVRGLTLSLPKRTSHDFGNWSQWEVIWEGDTYELQDLDGRDAKNLSQLLRKAISKTFRPLMLAVAKV